MNRIVDTRVLAPGVKHFRVEAPRLARKRRAGQFVIVRRVPRHGGAVSRAEWTFRFHRPRDPIRTAIQASMAHILIGCPRVESASCAVELSGIARNRLIG